MTSIDNQYIRETVFYNKRVEKEFDALLTSRIQKENLVYDKLSELMVRLAIAGERAVEGYEIIKMKFPKIHGIGIMIELKKQPYRAYCVLTTDKLCVLWVGQKKQQSIKKNVVKTIIDRAKDFLT